MGWINLVVYGVAAVFVIMLIGMILRFPFAINTSMKVGRIYRETLSNMTDQLRLGTMLQKLGIDKSQYLRDTDGHTMRQQLHNCSNCVVTDQCDEGFKQSDSIQVDEIAYCPNQDSLDEVLKSHSAKAQSDS